MIKNVVEVIIKIHYIFFHISLLLSAFIVLLLFAREKLHAKYDEKVVKSYNLQETLSENLNKLN